MQDLKITLIQTELHWQSAGANLSMLEEKLWTIEESTDLIILPEMFTTGFTMEAEKHAEHMNMASTKWLKQMSAQKNAVVTGSIIIKEENKFYNRLLWAEPEGKILYYDKRHLFRMAEENKIYSAGDKKLIRELKGWKVCPMICYDLRFPVWCRNVNLEYDLLLFVANWPAARSHAWKTLLRARAIENLAYVAGVNRVGRDGKGLEYSGDSAIVDMKGSTLKEITEAEGIIQYTLSRSSLDEFRVGFPANLDADSFLLQ
ncbi:MAG: amidohydrolase [Cytophagaceae bacterium]